MKLLAFGLSSLGLAAAASIATTAKVNYDGWRVYRVTVGDKSAKFSKVVNDIGLEIWKGKADKSPVVDVMVSPSQLSAFEKESGDLDVKLMHEDLGSSIFAEADFPAYAAMAEGEPISVYAAPNSTWFNAYHPIADHYSFIDDLAASYPDNAEAFVAGKSHDGRDIKGIHIYGSGGKGSKRGIVWHGTVHAREWITTMVTEYAAFQLLSSTDAAVKAYKDKYDFYIIPIVNPDGFAFSQSSDRMWRKNRQATTSASCVGRDINRNWPHASWSQRGGASTSPCAQDYKGPSAGDGVETKVLTAHLDSVAAGKGVQMYMDIHSYSQLWMYPYGYTCSGRVPDSAKYESLSRGAVAAIKAVHGTTYTHGPICNTIYQVSGDSVDYALENANATFSMTVELRDTGNYGFILPPEQIKPTSEEMWAGLSYVLTNM